MNRLPKLLLDNRGKGAFSVNAEKVPGEATIYLYDSIVMDDVWGGITAARFVDELSGIKAKTVHLRINSPGGDVFAARAIVQAILDYPGDVITHVDGVAASAASLVAIAGKEVRISDGGFIMIHKAWTISAGNADDMLATARLLEKVDETLVDTYFTKTGQPADKIIEWMRAETWFTAKEAIEYGFADVIEPGISAKMDWNLSAYAGGPEQLVSHDETLHLTKKLAILVGGKP